MPAKRRHVLHVSGYDAIEPPAQHGRFVKGLERLRATWSVGAEVVGPEDVAGAPVARWRFAASGPNWSTTTTYDVMRWDDIVRADLDRSMPRRLWLGSAAFADFVGSGTLVRYWRSSFRYALFFLYPFLATLALAALGFLLVWAATGAIGFDVPARIAAGLLLAPFLLLAALRLIGPRFKIRQGLDDWIFARDFMRGRRADMEARLDAFAAHLVGSARTGDADEILVVGHSFGASVAADMIARALALDPAFPRRGCRIAFLTVGATLPKFAMHPAGGRLRAAVAAIHAEEAIDWVEIHTRADPISFYRIDPVTLRRFDRETLPEKPSVRLVQIHDMVGASTYWRIVWRPMRLHYQVLFANERRADYDFYVHAFGPTSLAEMARLPRGARDAIGPDGGLLAGGPASATSPA